MPIEFEMKKPYPPQERFLRAKNRRIAYGGARGGGKSYAMRKKLCLLALRYTGIQILLLRRTFPELRENHILPLRKMLNGIATYRDSAKEFSFPNGSRIKLGYLANEGDILQYQGQAYEVIGMDEATQFTESQYQAMTECNRLSGNMEEAFTPRMYFTCNPGGVGHAWVKRLFIDRAYNDNENPEDYIFIPASVYDNKYMLENNPEYVRNLEALPPKRRKAMLEGNWDVYEGQFFDEFRNNPDGYDTHEFSHVINPFTPPAHWRIYRSFDFGYNKPFSCGWWAYSEDGVLYRILELYGCTKNANEGVRWAPDEIFRRIAEIERQHPYLVGRRIQGVADPACWKAESGESIAEVAERHGLFFDRASNARITGWMQVHNRLAFNSEGRARLYFFTTCKDTIRTIPLLLHDDHAVEDLDSDGEDHIADEIRYMCMQFIVKPRAQEDLDRRTREDPLNMQGGKKNAFV